MSLSTAVLLVVFSAILFGAKKPIIGIFVGSILLPVLVYFFHSHSIIFLFFSIIIGALIGGVTAFISSIFFAGMKGKGHNSGPSFLGGFGGGRGGAPPGGIILSDKERERLKK